MIPTELVLSPQSYAKIVSELAEKLGSQGVSHLQLAHHLRLDSLYPRGRHGPRHRKRIDP